MPDRIPCPCGKGFITQEESGEADDYVRGLVEEERKKWFEGVRLLKKKIAVQQGNYSYIVAHVANISETYIDGVLQGLNECESYIDECFQFASETEKLGTTQTEEKK